MKKIEYREVVEAIIFRGEKVLITKRSQLAKVAPNIWNVPAGKIKTGEHPEIAVLREVKEEVDYSLENGKFLGVREFEVDLGEYLRKRKVFTYSFVISNDFPEPKINFEHSEYCWCDRESLKLSKFETLDKDIVNYIKQEFEIINE